VEVTEIAMASTIPMFV